MQNAEFGIQNSEFGMKDAEWEYVLIRLCEAGHDLIRLCGATFP